MKLKVKINNQFYYCDENSILIENYNETLDTFKFHLSHLPQELVIEPFDKIEVVDEDNVLPTRYMEIDSYVMTQDTIGTDNNTYSYDISLFSETKELEGIILPNLSITPLKANKRSIYEYLKRYNNRYGKKGANRPATKTFNGKIRIYDKQNVEALDDPVSIRKSLDILGKAVGQATISNVSCKIIDDLGYEYPNSEIYDYGIYGEQIEVRIALEQIDEEVWTIHETPYIELPHIINEDINFKSNNINFDHIVIGSNVGIEYSGYYDDIVAYSQGTGWANQAYRTIDFGYAPTGNLLNWLRTYAIKKPEPTYLLFMVEFDVEFDYLSQEDINYTDYLFMDKLTATWDEDTQKYIATGYYYFPDFLNIDKDTAVAITDTDLILKTPDDRLIEDNPYTDITYYVLDQRIYFEIKMDDIQDHFNEIYITGAFQINYDIDIEFERNVWSYSTRVRQKFREIEAPELQWNTPTFREVLTDLFMIADCIPVLRNNVIDYIDLTEITGTFSNYNYLQKSRSSDDYLSEIKMDLQNVLNTDDDTISISSEWKPLTTNDLVITSENILYKTQYPILRVKHFWIGIIGTMITPYDYGDSMFVVEDLCNIKRSTDTNYSNMVYEYDEWKIKPILYKQTDLTNKNDWAELSGYQNFTLYYQRGSNEIRNFESTTKKGLWFNEELIKRYLVNIENNKNYTSYLPEGYTEMVLAESAGDGYIFGQPVFKIEYETTKDAVFSASKDDKPKNDRTIVDNQTNMWVDGKRQYQLEKQKANRMGNEIIMYNQRAIPTAYHTIDLIKIGNKNGDNVVYQTQYQIYRDHIECNAFATKDYILKNYFTGVNQKIRTWRNATNEAFVRHELDKRYVKFDVSPIESDYSESEIGLMLSPFDFVNSNNLNYCFASSPTQNIYYSINVDKKLLGKSIVIDTTLNSNTYYDYSYNVDELSIFTELNTPYIHKEANIGGIPLKINKYVDDNYEADKINFIYCSNCDNINLKMGDIIDPSEVENKYELLIKAPEVSYENFEDYKLFEGTFLEKDNKEIPALSIQYEFLDSEDIYITDEFVKQQSIIRNGNANNIKIYTAYRYDHDFIKGQKKVPDFAQEKGSSSRVVGDYVEFILDTAIIARSYLLYVADLDGNVLLGANLRNYTVGGHDKIKIYAGITKDRR